MYSIERNQGASQRSSVTSSLTGMERETDLLTKPVEVLPQIKTSSPRLWDNQHTAVKATLGMNRTRSLFSMSIGDSNNFSSPSVSSSSLESACYEHGEQSGHVVVTSPPVSLDFVPDVRRFTGDNPHTPNFNDSSLRKLMEPHLRKARLLREKSRKLPSALKEISPSIASSVGVPYTPLRQERPFLFDEHSHPLHQMLADALQVKDLSQLHHVTDADNQTLLQPLLNRERRKAFHTAYDHFLTSFCIPLLHSMAISKQIFQDHSPSSECITYRYQAFPTVQIVRPGSFSIPSPTCDTIGGHSVAYLTFYIPLTPSEGTNCLYTESHPGKEDWHPLTAKSFGLGYLFDGTRCLHFDLENSTDMTRVSLIFRVMLYREGDKSRWGETNNNVLCPPDIIEDSFSSNDGSTFYEEAVIDLRRASDAVFKKRCRRTLLDPDPRVGPPFC